MTEFKTPPNVFSFKLDMVGDETGARWRGKFSYKRPTVGMRRDISQIESILNDQYSQKYNIETPNSEVRSYNYTIAYLRICLEECPEWFVERNYGMDMEDENIVNFIAAKIKVFENSRIEKLEQLLAQPRKIEEKQEDMEESSEQG